MAAVLSKQVQFLFVDCKHNLYMYIFTLYTYIFIYFFGTLFMFSSRPLRPSLNS